MWQQRQRSAHLLQVAGRYGSFPIVLETFRECLQDVFDVPALIELLRSIGRREVRMVEVETSQPSPFASSLQFSYVSAFMYEGDVPLAERRAQALSLDRSLLAEIMGRQELRELIDVDALTSLELDLQMLSDDRKIGSIDFLHDALRSVGDLTIEEVAARLQDPDSAAGWLAALQEARRAIELRVAGETRWAAVEDAARFRDALGVALPMGLPQAFLEPVDDPLRDLVARYARTLGPFVAQAPAQRLGLGVVVVERSLRQLEASGRVIEGEFRPGGSGTEWVDVEVLRKLRRRSLAAFRKDVEPVPPEALTRFSLAWQGIGSAGPSREATIDAVYGVIQQLQGAPVPASALESQILPARLPAYSESLLDELGASGDVIWSGAGAIGSTDGWIVLASAADAASLLPPPATEELSEGGLEVPAALDGGGALFFRQLAEAVSLTDDSELLLSLVELVWSGWVTNDTLAPLRALLGRRSHRPSGRRRPNLPSRLGPPAGAGRWSLVPERGESSTRRIHAVAQQMLTRHGVVTRGSVQAEKVVGGFAAVYGVLRALEDSGRCRRGYFVEGLGGAQFALAGAVDRMRALTDGRSDQVVTQVLAAADPANPFGAALPWPDRETAGGHRPGRKAGAVVVLVDGHLVFYVEKGGKSLLSYPHDDDVVQPAVDALVLAAHDGLLGKLSVEKADGEPILEAPFAGALMEAGFRPTSRGLRLRA